MNVIVVDKEKCRFCGQPVLDGDRLVRTADWVAHLQCTIKEIRE